MTAALVFSHPGNPMLYKGKEIGLLGHPNFTSTIFFQDSSIQTINKEGHFSYYQKIFRIHKSNKALSGNAMNEPSVSSDGAM